MCSTLKYVIGSIGQSCRKYYNYTKISMGHYSLFAHVYVDDICNNKYKKDIEKFYLCNNIHNIDKLESILGTTFDNIILFDYHNNDIKISKQDNMIEINNTTKRIILGDISLEYIYDM